MKAMKHLICMAILALPGVAFAQSKQCEGYRAEAESALKEMAVLIQQNPRSDVARESAAANYLAVVNMNVNLAIAAKCNLQAWPPLNIHGYSIAAYKCLTSTDAKQDCDRARWKSGPPKPEN